MMKKGTRFFQLNNKGASLITVIITIGFIATLAGTVMMTSLVNYKMKRVNVYAKDTFYSAEQVLDEINIGLQRYISDSLGEAYMDVMQNYSDYSVEKKRMVMQTNYYESMWEKLQTDSTHKYYSIATLEGFLKESTKWRGDDEDGYGAILRAVKTDGTLDSKGGMETYDNGIVLKGIRVYYKDSKGFVSVIETDIRLTYPELDFAATTVLPDVSSYGVIADSGMVINGAASLALEGNFYADSVICESTNQEARKQIGHTGNGHVVVKHDMFLKNAAFSNEEDGTVWADGIETYGGSLSLNGQTMVANDLNVNGDGSIITLAGIYNGFGSSINEAKDSSAILINGINSSLDLSGIEKITLAGHAYVGTGKEVEAENEQTEGKSSRDVYTGESIAVKSNQLMYLIPPECIGVDTTTGESAYNKNPLTTEEYQTITGEPARFTEVSLDIEVAKLGSTLTDYIAKVNGVAKPEIVFVPTNDKPLVYYYMNFANEESANRYFARYYNANKEVYDKYMQTYVKLLEFPQTATVTRIKLAAGGVYGGLEEGYTFLPQTVEGASTQLSDNQLRYGERFTALCTKLTDHYAELTNLSMQPSEEGQIVFDNLVDATQLGAYIQECGESTTLRISGEYGDVVLTKAASYTVSDADICLVISTGDVIIDVPNYEGTVFADGLVTVNAGVRSIYANVEKVNAALRYYKEIDGKNVMVAQVLRDGKEYVFMAEDAENSERSTTSMADLVVYENWKKE